MFSSEKRSDEFVIGADIGGSHITATVINRSQKSIIAQSTVRAAIDANGSGSGILDTWTAVIAEVIKRSPGPVMHIGFAIPGPFNYENGLFLIKDQEKFRSLYQVDLKEKLSSSLDFAKAAISFRNDAACFLRGEALAGSLAGKTVGAGITLGTGLGSAWFQGDKFSDADLWHKPFKAGIAEDYLSSRWFIQRFQALSGNLISGVEELVQSFGDTTEAKVVFQEFSENLALFLNLYLNVKHYNSIVVGGNISKASHLFLESSALYLQRISRCYVHLTPSRLNESAALIGAAIL